MKNWKAKNGRIYQQPEDVADVKLLVTQAVHEKKTIIIKGAGHSFPLTDSNKASDKSIIYVLTTYLNKITSSDYNSGIFTVEAGCHLGFDPSDETGVSTLQNSLAYQLDPIDKNGKRKIPPGWSLPELGGISHQTVGGFIATGSAGGSIKYAFCDDIESIRVIFHDGKTIVDKVFSRPHDNDEDDPFWAIGYANLGLLGFVVEVTFKCQPAFNVAGTEVISDQSTTSLNLYKKFLPGKQLLRDFFENQDYCRVLWWPQNGIDKVLVWSAKQEKITDWQNFKPKPYKSLPLINGTTTLANKIFGAIFHFIGFTLVKIRCAVVKLFGTSPDRKKSIELWFTRLNIRILKLILNVFAKNGVQDFEDAWWRTLPMDNEISDQFSPVKFTELFIPIHRSEEVIAALNKFYDEPENAGTFCTELYAGKQNIFWLSPTYGSNMIRIDVFWFGRNIGDPVLYFERFWRFLQPFKFRYHWGKYLGYKNPHETQSYITGSYPRMSHFLALRKQHDPHDIFLNPYWKHHLGIT